MPNCFLVHGYGPIGNTDCGRNHVDRFGPLVEERGWTVQQFDYLIHWYSWHPLHLSSLGKRLAMRVEEGDIAIANSSGASVTFLALKHGAPFSRVILVEPILDNDAIFPHNGILQKICVWYSPSDMTADSGASLPFHIWGRLGKTGYIGDDPRVVNYNKETDFKMSAKHHSDIYLKEMFNYFGPIIVQDVPNLAAALKLK